MNRLTVVCVALLGSVLIAGHAHADRLFFTQDSLGGDPITHLRLSSAAHAHVAAALCRLADRYANGRVLALGGGGYNRANLAEAWNEVVEAFITATPDAAAN